MRGDAAAPAAAPAGAARSALPQAVQGDAPPVVATATPFVRVNPERGWVDIDARVVLRKGQDVRLLLCVKGTREHESILATEARPGHVHLALVGLGLTPGTPLKWTRQAGVVTAQAGQGPAVELMLRFEQDGQIIEVPAGHWVVDPQTDAPLPGEPWLFVGSMFVPVEDRSIYRADVTGAVVSLTPTGDEVLAYAQGRPARPGPLGDAGYVVQDRQLPQLDTPVVLRVRRLPPPPVPAPAPASAPEAASPAAAPDAASSASESAPVSASPASTDDAPASDPVE